MSLSSSFNKLRIKNKLIVVILLVAMPVLLLSSVSHISIEIRNFLIDMRENLSWVAHIVAQNSRAALVFDDKLGADEALEVFSGMPNIVSAIILDNSDQVFSVYNKDEDLTKDILSKMSTQIEQFEAGSFSQSSLDHVYNFDMDCLIVAIPIELDDEVIGRLFVASDLTPLTTAIGRTAAVTSFILLISLALVFWLSRLLQRVISGPVVTLTRTMKKVSDQSDYDVRLSPTTDDELGQLYDVFNEMLKELKEREGRLTEYREELEQKVSDRTFALKAANVELAKARDEAEDANRAKSDFVAMMSHEIRTPLNGVMGMAELLSITPLNKKQKHFVQVMEESGKNLLVVINDILDFSKIEAGKLDLDYTYFNLRNLIEELAFAFSHQVAEREIEMVVDLPTDLDIDIYGDNSRIRQILVNLIGNAIKFTEKGQVLLRADMSEKTGNVCRLKIEVEDSGVGIEESKIEKIQEAFTQADETTTRQFGGTGLGLAIVKRLLALMRSELKIRSTYGKGSSFSFDMLVYHKRASIGLERLHQEDLAGVKVMVVDDNPVNREVLSHQLESWSMDYSCVESGNAALKALELSESEGQPYDIAVIDYHMPEMDGLELAKCVREKWSSNDLKLIALSSAAESKGIVFRDVGIDAKIEKPARRDELVETMTSLLGSIAHEHEDSRGKEDLPSEWKQLDARILLVEDAAVNQEIGRAFLDMFNCTVEIAINGKECVDLFEVGKYDLILMDCLMPVLDGFGATRIIREVEDGQKNSIRIPVVALTANAFEGFNKECLAAGMDDYLSKPFNGQELMDMLVKWLPDRLNRNRSDGAS